jgi:hypothetical protein
MKFRNTLLIAMLVMIPGSVWAYGDSSGGGTEGCKVKFSKHMPANGAEVAEKSDFSVFVSGETNPHSIKVTIKGQSVPVTVTPKNQGFQVAGMLPDTLKGTFAKINITAKGPNQCESSDGWLVKVTE